jgi:hypothetical protein
MKNDLTELYLERVAIMQTEAGFSFDDARIKAYEDLQKAHDPVNIPKRVREMAENKNDSQWKGWVV